MRPWIISLSIALVVMPSVSFADDKRVVTTAKNLAENFCITCHGTNGVSVVDEFPALAGQDQEYLKQQLEDFRSGERESSVMNNMAVNLDDKLIKDLADYYSSIVPPE